MMPIFPWEIEIIEMAKQWPREGFLYSSMYYVSDKPTIALTVVALLLLIIWKKGYKFIISPFLFCIMAALFSEIISRKVIKAAIMRPRPSFLGLQCHASYCWGFVSSHTTSIFSIAVLLSLYNRRNIYWAFPLALLMSFSRIYLLEHFPLDVIGGAFVGSLLGFLVWKIRAAIYKKYFIAPIRLGDNLKY